MGPRLPPTELTWVYGWLDNDSEVNWSDNTNRSHLKQSLLGPFLKRSVGVWRCPADKSRSTFNGQRLERVRSYSMNNFLAVDRGPLDPWRVGRKITDLNSPSPAGTFVLIDEREDSIQDGVFAVDMYNPGPALASVPQSAHSRGGTLGFADGHSERKRWLDPRTIPPLKTRGHIGIWNEGGPSPDTEWLRKQTTGRVR